MAGQFSWAQAAEQLRRRRERLAVLRQQMEQCQVPLPFNDMFFLVQIFLGEDASPADLTKAEEIVSRYTLKQP